MKHAYHSNDCGRGYSGYQHHVVVVGNDAALQAHELHAYHINQRAYDMSQAGSREHVEGIVNSKIDARIAYKYRKAEQSHTHGASAQQQHEPNAFAEAVGGMT